MKNALSITSPARMRRGRSLLGLAVAGAAFGFGTAGALA
jgi:hypothetical protein